MPVRAKAAPLLLIIFILFAQGCSEKAERADLSFLKYNKPHVIEIDRLLSSPELDIRERSVLRGLRWCVVFFDNDANFNFAFKNYMTMLDELTLHRPHGELAAIVSRLVHKEFERAVPVLPDLFRPDVDGYEKFISLLPVAYHQRVPIDPLKKFAENHFSRVIPPDRMDEFRKASRERNYDSLTDWVVGAAFVNMAYRWKADREFRLPPDNYKSVMAECADIPLVHKYGDDGYHDQNYYATHVLLALNHYGQEVLRPTAISDRIFFYLSEQYNVVRNKVGDLDLLCEYLYCFRQFAPRGVQFMDEGEGYVMSLQNTDGSWGTEEDFEGDPYDRFHPTWTAITLLVQGGRN